jgi:hypothetical protein
MSEQMDGELSRIELRLEQEKLKIEHERLALERERLEAARERMRDSSNVQVNRDGQASVRLSTVAFSAIICLLVGGILGALSMSIQHDRRGAARLQEVMKTLNAVEEETQMAEAKPASSPTNAVATVVPRSPPPSSQPTWVRTIKSKRSGESGISLIVVQ